MKPRDWKLVESNSLYSIQRTYPDSTDVIISVVNNKGVYEVWSSVESRTSGPNENIDGTAEKLDSAKGIAHVEASDWDDDLL